MLKQHFSSFLLLLLSLNSVFAQTPIQVGEIHTIKSERLKSERTVQLYLPKSYMEDEKEYPTLYILDGQLYFMNGVAIQQSLHGEQMLPEMIVVGLVMERPERDDIFRSQWNEFEDFIMHELVPFIDNNYRTNGERILFGWETSGSVSSELLILDNSPFNGAISTNGAYTDQGLIDSFNKQEKGKKYLYLTNTDKDIYTITSTRQAVEQLEANDIPNLVWEFNEFNNEIHESLPYLAMYHGLKFYYHNFPSPAFIDISDFRKRGGITYLNTYFKERGERFSLSPEIDANTKNTLIWMAWKHDDFEAFKDFMTEFKDVLSTPRYASAYWQNRLGQYYLKYNDFSNAIPYFERGIKEYPDDQYMAQMYSGLGAAYLGNSDKKRAKANFKLAIQTAEKNSDDKLDFYQEQLKNVK